MSPINLEVFCGQGDPRSYLCRPFRLDGGTAATNGHILVWLEEGREGVDTLDAPQGFLDRIGVHIDRARETTSKADGSLIDVASITWPTMACAVCTGRGYVTQIDCPDCEGFGEFEHGNHTYDCMECDGWGLASSPEQADQTTCNSCIGTGLNYRCSTSLRHVQEGHNFSPAAIYVRLMQQHLPGCRITPEMRANTFHFAFEGGCGALSPITFREA